MVKQHIFHKEWFTLFFFSVYLCVNLFSDFQIVFKTFRVSCFFTVLVIFGHIFKKVFNFLIYKKFTKKKINVQFYPKIYFCANISVSNCAIIWTWPFTLKMTFRMCEKVFELKFFRSVTVITRYGHYPIQHTFKYSTLNIHMCELIPHMQNRIIISDQNILWKILMLHHILCKQRYGHYPQNVEYMTFHQ